MDESKRREITQWIVKAGRDLRSARRLYSDTPPLLDTAAYHCQQAAEKALKAFLTMHDIPVQKTPLLAPLVLQCMQRDPEFHALQETAETLTPFATAFRYPGDPIVLPGRAPLRIPCLTSLASSPVWRATSRSHSGAGAGTSRSLFF